MGGFCFHAGRRGESLAPGQARFPPRVHGCGAGGLEIATAVAPALDRKRYFVNYVFTLTSEKLVAMCSLPLVTRKKACERSPWCGSPAYVSQGHTLRAKAIVFGWLVFPKEANITLALITLKIAKR